MPSPRAASLRLPRLAFSAPVASMPVALQLITLVNPLRYFAELARSVLLKGAGFADLQIQLGALAILGVIIFGLAVSRFRKTLA